MSATATTDPVGMYLATTSTRTATVTVTAEAALSGSAYLAFVTPSTHPDTDTTWTAATWSDTDTDNGDGTHTRPCQLLVAGPDGLMTGSPYVIQSGEWDTWVRLVTSTERIEFKAQMLVVWP